jgi:WD40 repeat protein
VQVWNVADGSPVVTYRGHKGKVNAVIWFDNYNNLNPLFVSGSEDKTVQLWNISGKRIATYTKHTAPVTAVAASGSRIASSSADGTVHIWTPPAYK